ncbi:hypothetical protein [Corynebacterium lubricantis]|uniref:hypothetical protein n=1 Tax=Corynebacterium lubricantis TaxID=541095 RepID=UPI000375A110|nr:hypothetical protein [Corynebacterium lubricantis]
MSNPPNNGYPYNSDDDAESNQYPQYPQQDPQQDQGHWARYGESDYYSYGGYGSADPQFGQGNQHMQPMVNTNGKIDVFRSVSWAFPTMFSNAVVWILGALLTGVVIFILAVPMGMALAAGGGGQSSFFMDALAAIVGVFLSLFLLRGAIWQVDKRKITYRDLITEVNMWPAFATSLLVSLAMLVVSGGLALLIGGDQALALMGYSSTPITDPADISGRAILGVFLASIVAVLVRPLLAFPVHFIVERRATSIGQAFVLSYEAGKRNYLRLLGYNIVAGVLAMMIIVVTFGLAALIVLPALILIDAHMYRQAAGGPVPYDQSRDFDQNQGPQNQNYNGFL